MKKKMSQNVMIFLQIFAELHSRKCPEHLTGHVHMLHRVPACHPLHKDLYYMLVAILVKNPTKEECQKCDFSWVKVIRSQNSRKQRETTCLFFS